MSCVVEVGAAARVSFPNINGLIFLIFWLEPWPTTIGHDWVNGNWAFSRRWSNLTTTRRQELNAVAQQRA